MLAADAILHDARTTYAELDRKLADLPDAVKAAINLDILSMRKVLFGDLGKPNPSEAFRRWQQRHPGVGR